MKTSTNNQASGHLRLMGGVSDDEAQARRSSIRFLVQASLVVLGFFLCLKPGRVESQAALPVYTDSLVNGFQDWRWAKHDFANAAPVHSGSHSIAVMIDSSWAGLQICHPDINSANYSTVSLWLNGGTTGSIGQRRKWEC